jgi:hypothetical protein
LRFFFGEAGTRKTYFLAAGILFSLDKCLLMGDPLPSSYDEDDLKKISGLQVQKP